MNTLRRQFLQVTAPVHAVLRGKKVDAFMDLLGSDVSSSLLDVGGGAGLTGEFLRLYAAFKNVTIVNVAVPPQLASFSTDLRPDIVLGDGCCLPFRSQSFDWVFSNAVIEHVGGSDRQKQFADEIRRVARKGYFVTTPNKYFPIEPHCYLPFYQFLPESAQRSIIRLAPALVHDFASSKEIDLLTPREFRTMFPEAKVSKIGFPGIPNSLIAVYRAN
jgi:ubiquinone/menaquinone biosynthesis C-methylase UbiE